MTTPLGCFQCLRCLAISAVYALPVRCTECGDLAFCRNCIVPATLDEDDEAGPKAVCLGCAAICDFCGKHSPDGLTEVCTEKGSKGGYWDQEEPPQIEKYCPACVQAGDHLGVVTDRPKRERNEDDGQTYGHPGDFLKGDPHA